MIAIRLRLSIMKRNRLQETNVINNKLPNNQIRRQLIMNNNNKITLNHQRKKILNQQKQLILLSLVMKMKRNN